VGFRPGAIAEGGAFVLIVLIPLIAIIGIGVATAVVKLFIRWEREGKEHLVPLVLLGMLVVEATLYNDPNAVPRGLFHPGSGATQLRLPEIYITLAIIARLIARGRPIRIGLPAGLWLAFGAWMAVGAVEGKLYGNGLSQDLYEAKDIFYIVGAYALAAGVPIRRYIDSGALYKLGTLCVVCASALDLMTLAGVRVNTNLPGLPLVSFGTVGAETAALFLAIVAMCFMVRLASGPVRLIHVLALLPVIGSVLLADQRAVLVNLGTVVLVVVVGVIVGPRRGIARRYFVTGGHLILTALAIAAVGIVLVIVPAAVNRQAAQLPLASEAQSLFHNEAKAESAQDRLDLASEVEKLIPQHLLIGWGYGVEFQFYEAGTRTVETIPYAHNIVLDLWLRLGLIGLVLFALALGDSVKGGLRVWRRDLDRVTASLALVLVGVTAGLFATGLLEPLLDEYRFATLFGVSLGLLRACVTSMDERRRMPRGPLVITASRFATGGPR
jgi:O-antigen ligase